MGLQKIAFNFMVERGGKLAKSLLCSKPIQKPINFKGLKYAPALEKDTVQFANKETEQITKKADDLLKELRKEYNAEYTEKYVSETVENVAAGKVRTGDEFHYWEYKTLENFSKENPEAFLYVTAANRSGRKESLNEKIFESVPDPDPCRGDPGGGSDYSADAGQNQESEVGGDSA